MATNISQKVKRVKVYGDFHRHLSKFFVHRDSHEDGNECGDDYDDEKEDEEEDEGEDGEVRRKRGVGNMNA